MVENIDQEYSIETGEQPLRILGISRYNPFTFANDISDYLYDRNNLGKYSIHTMGINDFAFLLTELTYASEEEKQGFNFDLIITHLTGAPDLNELPILDPNTGFDQYHYPDLESLLKLLDKSGYQIPVIVLSSYAHHCLLPTHPLLKGAVKSLGSTEIIGKKLQELVKKVADNK